MSVKSTYNFVPAPKESEVFKPEWADQVSHDIPFSDGESGELELKITAKTPVFIRNGHSKDQDENEFSNYVDAEGKKHYFIPGSSLKGIIRNVLEIMSFSRMNQVKVFADNQSDVFGMRDMNNDEYKKKEIKGVKSGWLIRDDNQWIIQPCINHRIAIRDIEEKFRLEKNSLKGINGVQKQNKCEDKLKNKKYNFSFEKDLGKWVGDQYKFDERGDFEGYVVLYGDIDNKKYDYIFSEGKGVKYNVDHNLVDVLDSIELTNGDDSLWNYFKKAYTKIPVFFKLEKDTQDVKHFGLSKLYKLNNAHYINQLEPVKSYYAKPGKVKSDMAELIFGTIRNNSLKGRVFISHAIAINAVEKPSTERILNSPKPSFYPAYLKQQGENGILNPGTHYTTYHNENAELRGFKRYPVHLDIKANIESNNENISSQFSPLPEGTTFKGKVRFHNLKPEELGALASAITFHGNSDKFFHSIGGAKPFGFGKIKVEILSGDKVTKYMKYFELAINDHLKKIEHPSFVENKRIIELLSMSSNPKDENTDKLLTYPMLEKRVVRKGKEKIENEFNNYKTEKIYLEVYSERNEVYLIDSKIDDEFSNRIQEQKHETKSKKQEKQQLKIKTETIKKIEEKRKTEEATIVPQWVESSRLSKNKPKTIDAVVIGQNGKMMVIKPYVKGYENTKLETRYPAGMEKGTVINIDVRLAGKSLQIQGYPKKK